MNLNQDLDNQYSVVRSELEPEVKIIQVEFSTQAANRGQSSEWAACMQCLGGRGQTCIRKVTVY